MAYMMGHHGIARRRACRLVKLARSTQYYRSVKDPQLALRQRMREIAQVRVRYGYRRIHVLLRREGWKHGRNRTYRLYTEERLQLRSKLPKRRKMVVQRHFEICLRLQGGSCQTVFSDREDKRCFVEKIYFYIHPYFWPKAPIPDNANTDWPGFGHGIYAWTIQTQLRLAESGVDCELTSKLPERGVVFAHRECLSAIDGLFEGRVTRSASRYIVDISADLKPYPYANFHVVQNVFQERLYANASYIPHWPQPALIPRDANRGEAFVNAAYFGNFKNLPDELRSDAWARQLDALDMIWLEKYQKFKIQDPDSYECDVGWNDFRDIDVIIAIRELGGGHSGFRHKPASKLINAWLAGIPIIVGREYQYRAMRRSELDFIEVSSIDEALSALRLLKNNRDLVRRMVDNGRSRSLEYTADATTKKWRSLIEGTIVPAYQRWLRLGASQRLASLVSDVCGSHVRRVVAKFLG